MGQITNMITRVTDLLERWPVYRTNKYRVIAHILYYSLPEELKTKETRAVLKLIAQGRLPATETISRAHRKVLELHPSWRSVDVEKKNRKSEEDIKEQLRMIGGLEKL